MQLAGFEILHAPKPTPRSTSGQGGKPKPSRTFTGRNEVDWYWNRSTPSAEDFIFLLSSIAACWISSAGDVRNFSVRHHLLCGKAGFPAGIRVSSTAGQTSNLERHRCRFGMLSVRLGFTCIFKCKASPQHRARQAQSLKDFHGEE